MGGVGAEVGVGMGRPHIDGGGAEAVVGGVRPRSLLHLPRTQCHVVV